VSASTLIM